MVATHRAHSNQYRPFSMTDAVEMANLLRNENIESLKARYEDRAAKYWNFDLAPFTIADLLHTPQLSAVQLIKAAQCYMYQSNEHKGWTRSKARKLAHSMIDTALSHIPGYQEAEWGIEEKQQVIPAF